MKNVPDESFRSIFAGISCRVEVQAYIMTECHDLAENVPVPPGKYVVEVAGQQHEIHAVNVLVSFELCELEGVCRVVVDVVSHDYAFAFLLGASVVAHEVIAVSFEQIGQSFVAFIREKYVCPPLWVVMRVIIPAKFSALNADGRTSSHLLKYRY